VKRIERRVRATQDLEDAFSYYIDNTDVLVAERFLHEVDQAFAHISQHPGSPRYSHRPDGEQFRFWTLNRFPYAVFYLERVEYIEIVRVLHPSCDIPSHLEP
jgi:toxin ParE1/3/4